MMIILGHLSDRSDPARHPPAEIVRVQVRCAGLVSHQVTLRLRVGNSAKLSCRVGAVALKLDSRSTSQAMELIGETSLASARLSRAPLRDGKTLGDAVSHGENNRAG